MEKSVKYVGCVLVFVVFVVLFVYSGSEENVINGIDVPPVPDSVEDAASIGGVDTNGNIVRDSVERMLAEEFGDDPVFYEQAREYALAEQVAIMDPTEENVAAYVDLIRCLEDGKVSDDFDKIDDITINTDKRGDAYLEAFIGVSVTYEGC